MATFTKWFWFPSLMLLLGCSSALPQIKSEDFQLDLWAEWGLVGSGAPLEIHHSFTNGSASSVCIGGTDAFTMNGRSLHSQSLMDALCDQPLRIVLPGETIEWSKPWSGFRCLKDAPEGFLESFPQFRCGSVVELQSEVWIFGWHRNGPRWGGVRVVSPPQQVRLVADPPSPDTN